MNFKDLSKTRRKIRSKVAKSSAVWGALTLLALYLLGAFELIEPEYQWWLLWYALNCWFLYENCIRQMDRQKAWLVTNALGKFMLSTKVCAARGLELPRARDLRVLMRDVYDKEKFNSSAVWDYDELIDYAANEVADVYGSLSVRDLRLEDFDHQEDFALEEEDYEFDSELYLTRADMTDGTRKSWIEEFKSWVKGSSPSTEEKVQKLRKSLGYDD